MFPPAEDASAAEAERERLRRERRHELHDHRPQQQQQQTQQQQTQQQAEQQAYPPAPPARPHEARCHERRRDYDRGEPCTLPAVRLASHAGADGAPRLALNSGAYGAERHKLSRHYEVVYGYDAEAAGAVAEAVMAALYAQALPPRRERAHGAGAGEARRPAPQPARRKETLEERAAMVVRQQQQAVASTSGRPERELYVGNLAEQVTQETLKELFELSLKSVFQGDARDKVVGVRLHGEKPYGFVEFLDADLATAALSMSGVHLCGRPLTIGRPAYYQEHVEKLAAEAKANAATAARVIECTPYLHLTNVLPAKGDENAALDALGKSCRQHGEVLDACVLEGGDGGRCVLVQFGDSESAARAWAALSTCDFDGQHAVGRFLAENEFRAAKRS